MDAEISNVIFINTDSVLEKLHTRIYKEHDKFRNTITDNILSIIDIHYILRLRDFFAIVIVSFFFLPARVNGEFFLFCPNPARGNNKSNTTPLHRYIIIHCNNNYAL